MTNVTDQNSQMADQITELRAQVARLQAAVQKTGSGRRMNSKSSMGMSSTSNKRMGMEDRGEMGMVPGKGSMTAGSPPMGMKDAQDEMGGMTSGGNAGASPGMPMGDDKDEMSSMPMGGKGSSSPAPAMGMCCMGKKAPAGNANAMASGGGGMAGMSGPSSAMPGQAGTSHLYHIGSKGFFLNHSSHITLTPDQKLTLIHLKEKAMLESTYEQRRIAQAEQDLYILTGADQPDNSGIQKKVGEIEKMRAEQRMNFIRAVADASDVLSPEQRKALLGTMTATKQ